MIDKREVARVSDFSFEVLGYRCIRCGKPLQLYWNGGELGEVSCCGLLYRLEHTGIDLVVYDTEEGKSGWTR